MDDDISAGSADAALVKGWLTARSIARGLPLPVEDSGGWRVDTDLPGELRRYVFVHSTDGLQHIAHSVHQSRVLLKLFGTDVVMRPLLPPRWQIEAASFFMTLTGSFSGPSPLPSGYQIEVSAAGRVITARVRTRDGAVAAEGFAAETKDVFVYDRIVTDVSHRRRGLARAIMNALGNARSSPDAQQVLVATEDGCALYSAMGWIVRSPWTTAVIPDA